LAGCRCPKYLPKKKPDDDVEVPAVNPDYATWVAKDQTVLSYLLTNLSKEILCHVNTDVTVRGAWAAIEVLFASQSHASPCHDVKGYIYDQRVLHQDEELGG
jgi:hypothetical protein